MGRNVDRECDRQDIDESVWIAFLLEVAGQIVPEGEIRALAYDLWCDRGKPAGSPDADWHEAERRLHHNQILLPLEIMDSTVEGRRDAYMLRGGELPTAVGQLVYRYVTMSSFWAHNLRKRLPDTCHTACVGPDDSGFRKLFSWINQRAIDASWIVGTSLGGPDYPVWCTDSCLRSGGAGADDIRDKLGLKHVEGGYLVELAYPVESLRRHGESLRAPTVLDASASAAGNWIFLKNRNPGGPGWGYTARVPASGILEQGPPEAVHKHFLIESEDAAQMTLRAIGPIQRTTPSVDFEGSSNNANA